MEMAVTENASKQNVSQRAFDECFTVYAACDAEEMKPNAFSILIMTRNVFHDLFRSPKHARRRLPALKCLSVHSSGFGSDELSVMSCEIQFYKSDCVHHMLTTDKLLQGKWSHPHIIQNPFDFLPWNTKGEFLKKLAALFQLQKKTTKNDNKSSSYNLCIASQVLW